MWIPCFNKLPSPLLLLCHCSPPKMFFTYSCHRAIAKSRLCWWWTYCPWFNYFILVSIEGHKHTYKHSLCSLLLFFFSFFQHHHHRHHRCRRRRCYGCFFLANKNTIHSHPLRGFIYCVCSSDERKFRADDKNRDGEWVDLRRNIRSSNDDDNKNSLNTTTLPLKIMLFH